MCNTNEQRNLGHWKAILLTAVLLGVLFIVLYASFVQQGKSFAILSVGALLAGACLFGGGLVGFLFGIPRTLQKTPADDGDNARGKPQTEFLENTNLEQISDWLTKILVGVGLTQIGNIWDSLTGAANYFSSAVGGNTFGAPFAVALMVYYLTCGFLYGYLWTRLFLKQELRASDLAARAKQAAEQQIQTQARADAKALTLLEAFFHPDLENSEQRVSEEELKASIVQASVQARTVIFFDALEMRRHNSPYNSEDTPDNQAAMARTIPVFEALIDADVNREFHRNYAQLAYALKDLPEGERERDWKRARDLLDKAITIRNAAMESGWSWYEVNRAACTIALDERFRNNWPSSPDVKQRILSDLVGSNRTTQDYEIDETINKWIELNDVTDDDLADKTS